MLSGLHEIETAHTPIRAIVTRTLARPAPFRMIVAEITAQHEPLRAIIAELDAQHEPWQQAARELKAGITSDAASADPDPHWPGRPLSHQELVRILQAPSVAPLSRPQQLAIVRHCFGPEVSLRMFKSACRAAGPQRPNGRRPK